MNNRGVNTFDNNNHKNGGTYSDPVTSTNNLDSLQKFGLLAPNIVMLPVCSAKEAKNNWMNFTAFKRRSENYPCN